MELSIIMPSLNEEQGVGYILDNLPHELKKIKHEIILVDGGSEDKTTQIAKSKGIKVILSKKGYGIQYKEGFRAAKGDIIATMDSDGSYDLKDILRLTEILEKENLDFVSGDRLTKITKGVMNSHHYIANKYLNMWVRVLFGIKLKDSQSGMWVFRRDCLKDIRLEGEGMSFSEEMKIEAFKKLRSKEFHISYMPRLGKEKLNSLIDGHKVFFFLWYKKIKMIMGK